MQDITRHADDNIALDSQTIEKMLDFVDGAVTGKLNIKPRNNDPNIYLASIYFRRESEDDVFWGYNRNSSTLFSFILDMRGPSPIVQRLHIPYGKSRLLWDKFHDAVDELLRKVRLRIVMGETLIEFTEQNPEMREKHES